MDENEITAQEPRSINELVDLDYSEMTTEEIEIIIEWRAANKARDTAYRERMEALNNRSAELKALTMEQVKASKAVLAEMKSRARERYEKASADNGQA